MYFGINSERKFSSSSETVTVEVKNILLHYREIHLFFHGTHNNCEAKQLEAMLCVYVTLHMLLLPFLLTKYIL